ncbi:hypothetical protein [Nocardioides jensenii]|uniref:hypothetical protein n=1 Tax=Nocardioides jensenii TaxID=1843 RepID=UPI000B2F3807|nr:hypothetical protein [Nocardioides jensenii]
MSEFKAPRTEIEWCRRATINVVSVLPVSHGRAKSTFGTLVDPAEIDRVFDLWRDALPD